MSRGDGRGRAPDYDVSISRKRGEDQYINVRVGSAWIQERSGAIAIRLEQGLSVATPEGVFLTLWKHVPKDERGNRGGRR